MEISMECVTHEFNKTKILINGTLLIASIGLLTATPHLIADPKSASYMTLFCLAVIGIFYFTFNIFFRSKSLVYVPTGSQVTYKSINISLGNNSIHNIEDTLLLFNKERLYNLSSGDKNDILIDILYSSDNRFGAYRISHYVPYKFQTVREWTTIDENAVANLVKMTRS